MKRVLVLRAREDAERTASRLRGMGFEPLLSPVLPLTKPRARALCGFSPQMLKQMPLISVVLEWMAISGVNEA